jgi:16S rRNA (cytosine1402-N4)-methyltransferase
MSNKRPHTSILEDEMAGFFAGSHLKVYVDGTLGAGGHARRILQEHPEIECFIGFDQDPDALVIAKETLKEWEGKIHLVHANFDRLTEVLHERGVTAVDGFFLTSECRPCSSIKSSRDLVF